MEKEMGQKLDDPCIFEDFKGEQLDKIVADQFATVKKMKNKKTKANMLQYSITKSKF